MEDVLEVYTRPYDPLHPQVCVDEATKQLVADMIPPWPMQPGQPARADYEYERRGTANLFMVVEPLIGQVIEPLVYGHSTGLTPVAVILAATFWTWLWGPIGLLLSTPLTVCLGVLGRHVTWLRRAIEV